MRENAVFTSIFALDFILFCTFCTLLALSKFAENQIFRAVARVHTRTCNQVRFWFIIFFVDLLQHTGISLSLYWHMFILGTETDMQ